MSAVLNDPGRRVAHATRALRFLTAGSVDDGKSTLIGRLLLDSRAILADQLDALEKPRRRRSRSTCRCSPTASRPSANRASRSTSPTATSPPAAQVHHRRRARPRAVHAQHGHRRGRQRRRGGAGRHHQARLARADRCSCCRRRAATRCWRSCCACRASCSRSTSSMPSTDPQRRLRGGARRAAALRRTRPASTPAGIVPVSALRGDNVTHAAATPGLVQRPVAAAAARSACRPRDERTTARCCCRCSTWRAKTATAPATSRARSGAASPTAACSAGDAVQLFPSGEQRDAWPKCAAPASAVDAVDGRRSRPALVLDRQLDVSRGDWIATPAALQPTQRFERDAGLARHRAGRGRPQVLGAPRQPLGAGAHRRHRAPARHPHAAADRRARARASTRSAT